MGAFLKKYIWLWEMIACAIAISCAIIIVTVKPVLYLIIGVILAVLGLCRIVPLVKTTDDKALKWINAIELILNILVGGMLIFFGVICNKEGHEKLENFINNNFGYFLGGVFYLRGLVYFYTTVMKKEDTKLPLFIIHIILFTLGSFVIGLTIKDGFDYDTVKWTLFGIILLAAGFTGYNGIKGYINYRGNEQNEKATKKIKNVVVESENKVEAPTDESIKDQGDVNIDNNNVNNNVINNVINIEDNKEETPTIQA